MRASMALDLHTFLRFFLGHDILKVLQEKNFLQQFSLLDALMPQFLNTYLNIYYYLDINISILTYRR
jgi:hypothetical protein